MGRGFHCSGTLRWSNPAPDPVCRRLSKDSQAALIATVSPTAAHTETVSSAPKYGSEACALLGKSQRGSQYSTGESMVPSSLWLWDWCLQPIKMKDDKRSLAHACGMTVN